MDDDNFTKELLENVASLEKHLGLSDGFFLRLREEDDWSFIIKTHALVETAFTRLLEGLVGPSLAKFVNTLDLSGGRHSKLELLRLLGDTDSIDVRFVRGLSRIRNRLVHNITHVGFVIADYVSGLSAQDANLFVTETCVIFYNQKASSSDRERQRAAVLARPKLFIWRTALFFLSLTSIRIDTQRMKTENEERERKILTRQVETAHRLILNLESSSSIVGVTQNHALTAYQDFLKEQSSRTTNPKESEQK
jgi:hypothetical protein